MLQAPLGVIAILAIISDFSELLEEIDKIKGKIQGTLDAIQPPDAGEDGMPVVPPVPPTPGTTKMRQALVKLAEARQAAENLEPEAARDRLGEAKSLMRDSEVRQEFRRLRQARSWYDILREIRNAIQYLNGILEA